MAEAKSTTARDGRPRARELFYVYALAALVGAALGARGLVPFADRLRHSTSTAPARVGLALRDSNLALGAADRTALRADIDALRATWDGDREAFDLVVALRGLRDGEVDWALAEQRCKTLRWPRCDRPALEELRTRSRP